MIPRQLSQIIDLYYPDGSRRRDIFLNHSRSVARKAAEIARRCHLDLSPDQIETAAMAHDIGIALTDAPAIDCHGQAHYLLHGTLGAALLRENGIDETYARVAERHTGAGITADDVAARHLPMPPGRDYMPVTTLERLICYADKFYSKSGDMAEKPLAKVRQSLSRFGPESLSRFDDLHRQFSSPNQ